MLTTLMPARARRSRGVLPAVLVAAVALTACGGTDDDSGDAGDGVASLDDATDATDASDANDTASPSTTEPVDSEQALLEFAACMREHGVDMPDPQIDENGGVQIEIGGVGAGPGDPDVFQEAQEACAELMPRGPITRNGEDFDPSEMQDQMLEFAQCMRDHGIAMDDPDFSEEGRLEVTATIPEGGEAPSGPVLAGPFGTLDLSDPDVAAAFEECGADTGFGPPGGVAPAAPVGGGGSDSGTSDGDE
jgi:hypothetical protein